MPLDVGVGVNLPGLFLARFPQRELSPHPKADVVQPLAEHDRVGGDLQFGRWIGPHILPVGAGERDIHSTHLAIVEHGPIIHGAGGWVADVDDYAICTAVPLAVGHSQGDGVLSWLGIVVAGVAVCCGSVGIVETVAVQVPLVFHDLARLRLAPERAKVDSHRCPALVRHSDSARFYPCARLGLPTCDLARGGIEEQCQDDDQDKGSDAPFLKEAVCFLRFAGWSHHDSCSESGIGFVHPINGGW